MFSGACFPKSMKTQKAVFPKQRKPPKVVMYHKEVTLQPLGGGCLGLWILVCFEKQNLRMSPIKGKMRRPFQVWQMSGFHWLLPDSGNEFSVQIDFLSCCLNFCFFLFSYAFKVTITAALARTLRRKRTRSLLPG